MAMKKENLGHLQHLFKFNIIIFRIEGREGDLAWVVANLEAFQPTPLESIFKLLKVM